MDDVFKTITMITALKYTMHRQQDGQEVSKCLSVTMIVKSH